MNYGLQISASGMLTSLYRQDVFSNNLANINTTGFKPDLPATRQRDAARIEDGLGLLPSNELLERLGAGVMPAPSRIVLEQGPLIATGNPLDLAIEGEGFFVVRDESAPAGDGLRLTRDGRLTRDAQGRLVMASTGFPVLDEQNQPIVIPEGPEVMIGGDGLIRQGGQPLAQLRLVRLTDARQLTKLGHNLLTAPAGAIGDEAVGSVRQHTVEGAAVDPISAMMRVASAGRDAESNAGMIRHHDRLMDRAINVLGRVA